MNSGLEEPELGLSAADIKAMQFSPTKGFGRGYDSREVDRIFRQCVALVDRLTGRLESARAEIAALRNQLDQQDLDQQDSDAAIGRALDVLSTAQQTADKIIAAAEERRSQALEAASTARRDAERRARQITDDAKRRAAVQEQEATARVQRLNAAADLTQQEIDQQSLQLQRFRETNRAQVAEFLDGILDQVADQFGRANPLAAQAAAAARYRSNAAVARQSAGPGGRDGRGRRGLRVAGHTAAAADRWTDKNGSIASNGAGTLPTSSGAIASNGDALPTSTGAIASNGEALPTSTGAIASNGAGTPPTSADGIPDQPAPDEQR